MIGRWWGRRRPSPHAAEARRHLEQLEAQQPEVERLTRELQEERRRNLFAARIEAAFRGAP